MILVSISVMSALSFPYCVGTPRAFINMASLYIYLCGDDTTRVFYIYMALFVSSLLIDNSPQSVPPGRMLLGLYGLATIFVLSHMRMDIRMSHG